MESEIDPGMAASMWGDAMTALNDWRRRAERAEAEVERLHSWDGLMGLLDERWPDDIFPTLPDDNRRDPGPRIVSLLRWLASEREAHAGLRARLEALADVADERLRQDEKWGEQNHDPAVWLAILTEEVGELAEAILFDHSNGDERNHTHSADMRTEAIQVAAVAVQFVQFLDRRALAEPAAPVAAEEGGEQEAGEAQITDHPFSHDWNPGCGECGEPIRRHTHMEVLPDLNAGPLSLDEVRVIPTPPGAVWLDRRAAAPSGSDDTKGGAS